MEKQKEGGEEDSYRKDDIHVDIQKGELTGKMRIRLTPRVKLLSFCSELPWEGGRKSEGGTKEDEDQDDDVYEAREVYKAPTMTWLKVYKNGKR